MANLNLLEECIQGSVERVTFHSEESGFCVLRAKIKSQRDLVTVVGNSISISAGEYIECSGSWVNDKNYGLQFRASQLKTILPTTLEGIEKYLGSGMVKGIGPHFAKKLVKAFGLEVFEVIELRPEKLLALGGIGEKRQVRIITAWAEQKSVRDIMIFLQSHGVGTARAVRIYKTYGDKAVSLVRENPYRLALDIQGIGFKTADQIAQRLGIAKDSLIRAQAGIHHVLNEMCEKGHCAVERVKLITSSHELLEIPIEIIEDAIIAEQLEKRLAMDDIDGQDCVYPIFLYHAESNSAEMIKNLNRGELPWGNIEIAKVIPWVENQTQIKLSSSQINALKTVLVSKVSIITGGPGVGKTTLVNSLLRIIRAKRLSIGLCAPTGRAAKRLSETTGLLAKTIHRLLEFEPKTYCFKYNRANPLPIDVLIVDESSMIDILLFNQLLKAIPLHAGIVLVGDIDQLPSVGSGSVLSDLIASQVISTVRLTEIFRQAAHSKIILNAHRINQGRMPLPNDSPQSDFFTLYCDTPEEIRDSLIDVVCKRLPKFYQCYPLTDIQVLTPMNRGILGSRELNIVLQQQLNGQSEPKITRFGTTFSPGDKIIQIINNYDKEVFNGDIGFIEKIDLEEQILCIRFDQGIKEYEVNELDELSLAYAISIHKSQGSEFPMVVMPVSTQHFALLARNLLYTGITRGRKLVVLIGQKKAVGMAIHNNKAMQRLTKLAERLVN